MEEKVPFFDQMDLRYSKVDIGWHLEHSVITMGTIAELLIASNPEEYRRTLNLYRMGVMITHWLPRGVGKAPKVSLPSEVRCETTLRSNLRQVRLKVRELDRLHSKSFFCHPVLGKLNLKQTMFFLKIHTEHHLKIINDILSE